MPAPAMPYRSLPFDDVHPVAFTRVSAERAGEVAPSTTAIVTATSTDAATAGVLRPDMSPPC